MRTNGIGAAIAAVHALPDGAAGQFDAFHTLLLDWNARMDLTAVPEGEMLQKHYLDALTAVDLLPHGARAVDVGTGAGFPGVPLLLARPDLSMVLLDARRKRVDFLSAALMALGLDSGRAEAVHARAEDFARAERTAFDVAVSRAVAALPLLLEWMLPLVRVGGRCVVWKGPGAAEEVEEARRIAPLLGGGEVRAVDAAVPGGGEGHVLVIVEKAGETDARFPRRGAAAKKGL